MFTHSSVIKQFYLKQFNLALIKVKWFQVLLCITKNLIKHLSFIYTQFSDQTVLFKTIQFSISQFSNSSIWPIDRTLSDATTLVQSEPRSKGNEGILQVPLRSSIRFISVVSRTLVEGCITPLQWCSWCILQSQPTEFISVK